MPKNKPTVIHFFDVTWRRLVIIYDHIVPRIEEVKKQLRWVVTHDKIRLKINVRIYCLQKRSTKVTNSRWEVGT